MKYEVLRRWDMQTYAQGLTDKTEAMRQAHRLALLNREVTFIVTTSAGKLVQSYFYNEQYMKR